MTAYVFHLGGASSTKAIFHAAGGPLEGIVHGESEHREINDDGSGLGVHETGTDDAQHEGPGETAPHQNVRRTLTSSAYVRSSLRERIHEKRSVWSYSSKMIWSRVDDERLRAYVR